MLICIEVEFELFKTFAAYTMAIESRAFVYQFLGRVFAQNLRNYVKLKRVRTFDSLPLIIENVHVASEP